GAADYVRPAEQEQPDEDHEDQPEDEPRKRTPFGRLTSPQAEGDGGPEGRSLHDVPQDAVADDAHAEHQGCDDGKTAEGDAHVVELRSARRIFRRPGRIPDGSQT